MIDILDDYIEYLELNDGISITEILVLMFCFIFLPLFALCLYRYILKMKIKNIQCDEKEMLWV